MRRGWTVLVVACLAILCAGGVARAVQDALRAKELPAAGKYGVELPDGRLIWRGVVDVYGPVVNAEREAIALLGDIHEMEEYPTVAMGAVEFLGRIRSVDAVPALAERLTWVPSTRLWNALREAEREQRPPCALALVSIGLPGVNGLLDYVSEHEVDDRYRDVVLRVIRDILGPQRAAEYIQERIDNESDTTNRERLERLMV